MIKKSLTIEKILLEEKMESVLCPICEATATESNDKITSNFGYPNVKFQSVICRNCGLGRINPRMTQKGFERFYKEAFFEYLDPYNRPAYVDEFENTTNEKHWSFSRAKIMPYLYSFLKPEHKKVLDIGGRVRYYFVSF